MTRKVRYPLKAKLIIFLSVLLSASIFFYVQYAVDLFKEDKSAYIFETSLSHTSSLAERIESQLEVNEQVLRLMGERIQINPNDAFLKSLFLSNSSLLVFKAYDKNQKVISALFRDDLAKDKRNKFISPLFKNIKDRKLFLEPRVESSITPHFILGLFLEKEDIYLVGRFESLQLESLLSENKIYASTVMTMSREKFVWSEEQKVFDKNAEAYSDIFSSEVAQGAKTLKIDNKEYLVGFNRLSKLGVMVLSSIPQEKAFLAASHLIRQSFYFGLLVLAIAIILGILFARTLTKPLADLFSTTQKIAEGDFQSRTKISSNDEIGALSDSMNFMSDEIVRYMEEMKEKLRLENEIQVAQLVQSSFFPPDDIDLKKLTLAAHYKPASECGGDWWGLIDFGDKQALIIADATGHGVPAALLTATAHCCSSLIEHMAKKDLELQNSPAQMLALMNMAVCAAGSKVLMTCFVAVFDHANNTMIYANASHNAPFHLKQSQKPWDRKSFHPLLEANGPRLGHEVNATYADKKVDTEQDDIIVFFTDGVIENYNPEGKQWGQRTFLKVAAEALKNDVTSGRDIITKEAYDFYNGKALDDDITIVLTLIK